MTFLVSMIPVIELRGAIPLGVAHGLSLSSVVLISVIGNMVPVPFIIIFIRKIFEWLKKTNKKTREIILKLEERGNRQSKVVLDYQLVGLCLLVAIPFPGTGAWTGALVAALLELRLKTALPVIFVGLCIAAGLVSWLTCTAVAMGI